MSDSPRTARRKWQAMESVIERFELAWQSGQPPDLDDYVKPLPDVEQTALLAELISIDLEYRWQHGEPTPIEVYWDRFPQLSANQVVRQQLIEQECRVRRRCGIEPSPNELSQRFGGLYTSMEGQENLGRASIADAEAGTPAGPKARCRRFGRCRAASRKAAAFGWGAIG